MVRIRMKLVNAIAVMLAVVSAMAPSCAGVEFAAAKGYTVGNGPRALASGDFNGDGKVDLAVANGGSGNVSVLLGIGDGTFKPAVNFDAGIAALQEIFVGDFNGDGKVDLAVFAAGNAENNVVGTVSVLLGNGDGTFQAGKVTSLTMYTTQIGVADFNGDRKADLVASEFNTAFTLSILTGKGDGTFQSAMPLTNPVSCADGVPVVACVVFAAADFDKDGKADLVVAGSGGLQVLLGNGDGTFRDGPAVAMTDGYSVGFISTADLNGDGVTDLVVMSTTRSCAGYNCVVTMQDSVFLGTGNGSFEAEQIFGTGSSSRSEFGFGGNDEIGNILAADFDGDGKLDIVDRHSVATSRFLPTTVTMEVRLGRGDGTFATPIVSADPGTIGVATDLNGDKLAELVAIGTSNDVDVLVNDSPTSGSDLALMLTGASPEPVGVGQNLTYSAIVLNEGPENATGVIYQDKLPAGVTYVSGTSTLGNCSTASGVVTCSIGALAKAASAQVKVIVTPTSVAAISNSMSVVGSEADGNLTNNNAMQASTVVAVYTLTVSKTGSGGGSVGASLGINGGIDCGNTCAARYLSGTIVDVGEDPDVNSSFDGYSGACSGMSCELTMDRDKTVTATFTTLPDFQVSPTAASLVMAWGGQASEAVNFAAVGEFTGTIAATCSVSGSGPIPTCSVSPSAVAAGHSVTLSVSAAGPRAGLERDRDKFGMASAAWLPFGIVGCLLGVGFDKKRARKWTACLLVMVASTLPVACGGGGSPKPVAQSYVVTVTGVSGPIAHTASVNVTVGQ